MAKALSTNISIQILDLSYCSFGGARENLDKLNAAELKEQLAQINKIKSSKNGMDPEKMGQDLEAYFANL